MEKTKELPSMGKVFLVLGGFLALAFAFTTLGISIHLAIFSGWFLAIGVGLSLGYTYEELEDAISDGIHNGMSAVIILLAVGALVGTWISGGIVPTIIYYGLKTIHPSIFFLATLIICTLTSLSTGTSWGAAGTAGIAMMGIGAGLGVPDPMTAGAVLSGAYFGDKLSPLSDSTILSASMSDVDVIEHVKGMFPASVVGYAIAAIGFTILGFNVGGGSTDLNRVNEVMNAIEGMYNINPLSFLPLVIVIGLLIMEKPSIPVITFGSVLGIIWGIGFQGLEPVKAIGTAWSQIPKDTGMEFIDSILSRGGMQSMLWSVGVILFGLGFGGLLDEIGILEAIAKKVEKGINSGGSLTVTTILVGFLGNLFGSAMYVSLILTPKIMEKKYDELGYDRKVLSRNTEFGGTLTSGMIPWSDNGIYMAGILGVSTLDYLPYMWLAFACIGVSIIYGFTDKFMYRVDDEATDDGMTV
ncbi:Na+/H+ antiporter NhaC [Acetohalobium arabaticum]|uniref:Transporter, NhaC family (TC 2.A.35) n=1 Tax=Acetohalobium arabaticum (strain ATCC 49924 / DSM 5501 / Z-7288) TaxID=574087 RepID=D9QV02_ACEAZ|nr:Na+/H+ antiporter NhaC [Acetohalobium arabaticum]ADL12061.1 transporter, NhaC family (TC 2.A.35) [Acetohalobium arabaticum DSM 5501]